MSAETLIVTNSDATTDKTFTKVLDSGNKSTFARTGLAPSAAESIDMDHTFQPENKLTGNDRHSVTIRKAVSATVNGTDTIVVGSVTLTLSIPRVSAWTLTMTKDLTKNLQCLLKDSYVADIVAGVNQSGDLHQDSFTPGS